MKARLSEEDLEAIEATGGGEDNKLRIVECPDAPGFLKSEVRLFQAWTFWSIMRRRSGPGSRRREARAILKTEGCSDGFCVPGLIEIKKALSINGPTGL